MKAASPTKSAERSKNPDAGNSEVEPARRGSATKLGKSTPDSAKKGRPLVSERKKSSGKQGKLLSPSSQPPRSCALTPDPKRADMQDSPYKPAPASPAAAMADPATSGLASLRHYLRTLKPDNLATTIFRDQNSGATGAFPVTWIKQVQDSLQDIVRELMTAVLAAAPADKLPTLLPPLDGDQAFAWSGFGKLSTKLWKDYAELALSEQSPPRLTRGLLAELADELQRTPAFLALHPEKREDVLNDALFSVLVWNGILSPMMKAAPDTHKRLVIYWCLYIKVAHGLSATTQGDAGQHIISLLKQSHAKQCAAFQKGLLDEVQHLALLRTVCVNDAHDDHRRNKRRESGMDRHFTDTWIARDDDYGNQVSLGNYFLTDQDGVIQQCRSYDELREYVGPGARDQLAQVLLHVAGDRISNFLCQTYLYDLDQPCFTDEKGRRVDPVPELKTSFTLSRKDDGVISVQFCCHDDAVKSVMLGRDEAEFEATPCLPASIIFNGEMRFYPSEEFESGRIDMEGTNLHLFR